MPHGLHHADYRDALASMSRAFLERCHGSLDQAIPFLEGWTQQDLVMHLGRAYAFATANLTSGSTERVLPGPEADPAGADGLTGWLDTRRSELLNASENTDPASPSWTFAPPGTAGWWARRMACETAVHLWDLDAAQVGPDRANPIERDLALAAIDEYTELALRPTSLLPGRNFPSDSLHLHCTDGDGEWMIVPTDDDVVITHEHGKGAVAVRGPASSLLLWLWARPVEDVELFGDPGVGAAWQRLAP